MLTADAAVSVVINSPLLKSHAENARMYYSIVGLQR